MGAGGAGERRPGVGGQAACRPGAFPCQGAARGIGGRAGGRVAGVGACRVKVGRCCRKLPVGRRGGIGRGGWVGRRVDAAPPGLQRRVVLPCCAAAARPAEAGGRGVCVCARADDDLGGTRDQQAPAQPDSTSSGPARCDWHGPHRRAGPVVGPAAPRGSVGTPWARPDFTQAPFPLPFPVEQRERGRAAGAPADRR